MKNVLLVCLSSVFIFACSGSKKSFDQSAGQDPIKEQIELIEMHIKDPEKRDKCITVVKEWEQTLTEFYEGYRTHLEKIRALQIDYQSTREQFETAFDNIDSWEW